MAMMDVVIPVRISQDRTDVLDRLAYHLMDDKIPNNINFIICDDGSDDIYIDELKSKCAELGMRFLSTGMKSKIFSAGRARNFAVGHSSADFILFQDLDLMPYSGFYQDAFLECYVQELDKYADRFVMFGVIYLSELATQEFMQTDSKLRKSKFINYLLDNDTQRIEKFSTGTSVTIWRRDHYLCTGGNDPEFAGWGYEDLEYVCRAIRRNRVFPLPVDFALDYRNFTQIQEYKGWKSIYRLYGDRTANKGMYMFHSWHPVDNNGTYMKLKAINKTVFERKLKEYALEHKEPPALPSVDNGKSLLFRSNPWVLNRWTRPALGEVIIISDEYFQENDLLAYLTKHNITRVIFHNPYATELMLSLYRTVRENEIEYIVCERGALRDSVFFDTRGFNADSDSYSSKYWDKQLTEQDYKSTLEYIQLEQIEESSLELQSTRLSVGRLKTKLGLKASSKVLFIPLQRPSDTVIKYLCGRIGNYDNFISLVQDVVDRLDPTWNVVVKKHPLEVDVPILEGVTYANDENINSLLDMSDAVLLINSGVGVTSLIYNKPTFVAGDAFYDHEGLTYSVSTANDVLDNLEIFKPDYERVIKFISYLLNDFYSFGKFTTRLVDWEGGAKMTATTAIDFYIVRFPGEQEMILEKSHKPYVGHKSILFDRYKNPAGEVSVNVSKSPVKQVVKNQEVILSVPTKNDGKAKWKKFRNNPKGFIKDSKRFPLNVISKLIK